MKSCFADDADVRRRGKRCRRLLLLWLLLCAVSVPAARAADSKGPTVHLRYGKEEAVANPVADFMYFVPLISPEPVSSLLSPGSTQSVRMISTKRRVLGHNFTTDCELELKGDGRQQTIFDLAQTIRRRDRELQKGETLPRQLKSIDVQGSGAITVEVKGAVNNDVSTVSEVRLHFNAHGHISPVWIDLCDIHRVKGDLRKDNEVLARVNTLTFRRKPGPPTMEVSVSSIKDKDSGNGFWQNLKGRMVGAAADLFMPPLKVEAAGHQAMLDFGQALISGAPTFTFPLARNLRVESAP
jgi:hypothetical protein